ncbi:trans-sialidase [Trypanosoma cruzi]|nr:trans-sialidase [Trypanosoma cruzi]
MLQCSLMFLVHSVLATAAFRGNEKERCIESAPWLSSSVEMLHGVWRYCSEMPNHHARGRGTEWKTSFLFCVCYCECGCGRVGLVGTMAAACGCRSVLSGNML